jgi:arylsulfatase A-like enzyme
MMARFHFGIESCYMAPQLKSALVLASVFCGIGTAPTAAEPSRPNVILFLVDDMGWMDSEPYGSRYYRTPNMTRLAQRGMLFTDAYAMPLCSPTRASILSGQYSSRHGVLTASGHQPPQPPGFQFLPERAAATRPIVTPISKNYLEPTQYTLAEALRDAGYRTAHIGKWHLGLTEPYWPEQQGFDVALHGHPDPGPPSYHSPYGYRQHQSFPDGPKGEYITDRFTDEAIQFIEAHRDRPFYLNLWHHGVHGPWGHKEEYTKRFVGVKDPRGEQGNPIMASMLQSIDESLGRLLDALDKHQLAEKTVFIFFSDNGGNVHSNTPDDAKRKGRDTNKKSPQLADWRKWAGDLPPTNNAPLRNGKGTLYEGGTRVPLMVMQPGVVPANAKTSAVVHAIDLYPTVLELTNVKPNPQQILDGVSFARVLRDPQAMLPRQAVFNYFPMGGPQKPGGVWVRQGDCKLIRWFETGPDYPELRELYNLQDDLGESKNLAKELPDKVRELDALIDGFLKDTKALAPKPNPDYQTTATTPAAKTGGTAAIAGWVPKSCTTELKDGALVVTGDGKSPFIAKTGLKLSGPVTLRLHSRSAGGAAKVQWRTTGQEQFLSTGQTVDFVLPAGSEWTDIAVELPVKGSLQHLRLYLPAQQPVALDWIELKPTQSSPQRWEFNGP